MVIRTLLVSVGSLVAVGCADPAWTSAGSLVEARAHHSATVLAGDLVLFAGGRAGGVLSSAELFDMASGQWVVADPLREARAGHSATRLDDGRALLAGGESGAGDALKSAEIYDPTAGRYSSTEPMSEPRTGHTATPILEGKSILVAGGAGDGPAHITVELFDVAMETWSSGAKPMLNARRDHTATELKDGSILVAGGGDDAADSAYASVEIFDPGTGNWSEAKPMLEPRRNHTATRLRDGNVLVVGGRKQGAALTSAEIYDVEKKTWESVGALREARFGHTATQLDTGQILAAGGEGGSGALSSAEIYTIATKEWSAVEPMASRRQGHTATCLPTGDVLIVGGRDVDAHASAERFTPEEPGFFCERTEDCPSRLVCNEEKRCEHVPAPLTSRGACAAARVGSAAPGSAAMAVFLGVLMVACRRRLGRSRRAAIGLLAGAILLASPRRSEAQTATFSLERLQIAGSPDDGMAIFRPAFGPTQLFSQLALVYTRNALRADTFVHDAARAEALRGPAVALQLTTHITAGAAIDGRGAIQVSVPMIIAQRGYSTKNGSAGLDREVLLAPSALGDMRIDGRVLLGRNEAKTLSFAARGAIFLPTGDETSFAGDRGVGGNAGLAAELDAGMLFVTLNLGASLRPKSSFVDLTVGSELVYGLSAYVPLEQGRVRLGAELFGSAGILPETLGVMESAPLEWSLNGRFALGDKAPVFMGLGAGSRITAGYAPDIRLVARVGGAFSVETEESPPPRLLVPSTAADDDADGDGVPDLQDVCPGEKEDHKRLEDGCAEHDRDEDGLVVAMDKCPAEAESKNGINDADGCPEIDTDGDGLPDEVDPCPKEPGEQGCPPPQPVIRLQIEFASKQATIDPTSYPVLDELAGRLVASPEIKLVRIEGHTDDRGDARSNERLSKERASAVRKYLVERGRVDPARLVSEGLGSSRPITSNDTPEGRARNRRVELHIVK